MTTWVLLRGLAREARHWGSFPQLLQQSLPAGDAVLALDLPGNGRRCGERSPLTVAEMVGAARAELVRLGRPSPFVLVALSLGGMVAVQWAAAAPHEVRACVLVNSSVGAFSPFWQRLRPGSWSRLLRWLLPGSSALQRERAVYLATSSRPPDPAVIDTWASFAVDQPVSPSNAARQLVAAARFRAPARLAVPGLVLVSREDRLVSPRCSAAIARGWNLPLREHPLAGHDLPLDDPAWLAAQIADWYALRFA